MIHYDFFSVKPAIFDLVLAAAIGAYLGVFYFISLVRQVFIALVLGSFSLVFSSFMHLLDKAVNTKTYFALGSVV